MRVSVDHGRCVGAGNCVFAAPKVFTQDEDGLVLLLDAAPSAEQGDAVREAQMLCPSQVIAVED